MSEPSSSNILPSGQSDDNKKETITTATKQKNDIKTMTGVLEKFNSSNSSLNIETANLLLKKNNSLLARTEIDAAASSSIRTSQNELLDSSNSLVGLAAAKMAAKQFKKGSKKTTLQAKAQKIAQRMDEKLKLPPTALSRLTGTIFSHENDIPEVLRPTLQNLASNLEMVEAQIEAFKPTIEMLIYWETLTSALFITFSILTTWFLTKFGFHFLWTFMILFVVVGAFKRNQERLRRKIHHDVKVAFTRNKLEDESEAVEWLNIFLEKFWMQYEPSLSESIAASVNWALEANKPAFLDDLRLSQFTLGSEAPRVEFIKSFPRTAEDFLMMDLALSFQPFDEDELSKKQRAFTNKRNSKIELVARIGKSVASIPIPVLLTEINFSGILRAQFKFCTSFPHIEMMEFGFVERPKVDFILRPLKGMDLMDMPGLSTFVDDTINWALDSFVVDPNTIKIPLLEWMGSAQEADPVLGVLAITMVNGRSLKNTELTGKADPYAKIHIGGLEVARTKVIDDDLDPTWNETLYILIRKSHVQPSLPNQDDLKIEVMDYNNLSKDRSMGASQILKLSQWMSLLEEDDDEQEEEELVEGENNNTDTSQQKDKKKKTLLLTEKEKEILIETWGHPYDSKTLKKELFDDNKQKPNGGFVSLKINFFEVEPPKIPAVAGSAADAEQAASEMALEDEEDEDEGATISGVLSVTIHQAKDIPVTAKSCNAFVTFELNNGQEFGKTFVRKKTNTPVWEQKFDVFILDMDSSRLKVILKDEKDTGANDLGSLSLKVANLIDRKETGNDWFAIIDGKGGKLRMSFKFQKINLNDSGSHGTRYPLGVVRIAIKEAKGLLNVEAFKKSDPYAALKVEGHVIGKTHTIENTLDPVWNEMYYALVYNINTRIQFDVFDYNDIRKDRKLGKCELLLIDLLEKEVITSRPSASAIRAKPDLAHIEALAIFERDGFAITRDGHSADGWCPLYLISDQFGDAVFSTDFKKHVESKAIKQKGHLHFGLDYFPALPDYFIVPEKVRVDSLERIDDSKSILPSKEQTEEPEEEEQGTDANEEKEGGKTYTSSLEKKKSIITFAKSEDSKAKLSRMSTLTTTSGIKRQLIQETLETHPTGILRFKLHEAKGLSKSANVYARIKIAGEIDYIDTQTLKKTNEPIWNETHDLFIKHVFTSSLNVSIYDAQQNKDSDDVLLYTFKIDKLEEKIGKGYLWSSSDAQKNENETTEEICCSYGFVPVTLSLDQAEISDNSGVLQVDIIKAENLESVDSNGLSDPYCSILLNNTRVAKTKVHKKTLNPVFNESFSIPIESRHRSNIVIEIRDYNMLQKSTVIATLTVPMSRVPANSIIEDDFELEGTVRGTLTMRLTFSTKQAEKSHSPLIETMKGIWKSDKNKSEVSLVSIADDGKKNAEPEASLSRLSSTVISRGVTWTSLDLKPKSQSLTGELRLTIESARNLKSVDSNGLSDPYVKAVHNYHGKVRTIHKTVVVKKSLNPKFDSKKETFRVNFPPTQIRFILKDHNTFGDSKDMGEAEFDVTRIIGEVKPGQTDYPIDVWLPIAMGGSGELHVYGTAILGPVKNHSRASSDVGFTKTTSDGPNQNPSELNLFMSPLIEKPE